MDKNRTKKKGGFPWRLVLGGVFLAVFLFAAYRLADELISAKKEQSALDDLAALVAQNTDPASSSRTRRGSGGTVQQNGSRLSLDSSPAGSGSGEAASGGDLNEGDLNTQEESGPLPQYLVLYEKNQDFFAWITIDDTPINYPVMHTPQYPEYYLHRAFDGSHAGSGLPFMDAACDPEGSYYLVYGHHMKNGSMFGTLPEYAKKEYRDEHPIIYFDTLYEQREYEVVTAFYSRVYERDAKNVFRYYSYKDLPDQETFDEYVSNVRAVALYDADFELSFGDELLVLSTCDYHYDDGRFVLVARRLS